jgi:hypothetical protein
MAAFKVAQLLQKLPYFPLLHLLQAAKRVLWSVVQCPKYVAIQNFLVPVVNDRAHLSLEKRSRILCVARNESRDNRNVRDMVELPVFRHCNFYSDMVFLAASCELYRKLPV